MDKNAIKKYAVWARNELIARVTLVTRVKLGKRVRDARAEAPEEVVEPVYEEANYDVVRVKKFSVKPMDVDDAITQMELLGHNFFLFMNAENNDALCVLYRRNDGTYGLLVPEK